MLVSLRTASLESDDPHNHPCPELNNTRTMRFATAHQHPTETETEIFTDYPASVYHWSLAKNAWL